MSVLGESEAFFLFFLGGLDIERRVCEFVGEPGAILPRKIFKPGALHEIFSVESKSFQQVLSKVATF